MHTMGMRHGFRLKHLRGVLAAAFLALTLLISGSPAVSAQEAADHLWVVNSTDDRDDADLTDGVCRTSAGTCSLRAAISQSNAVRGPDRIEFAIGSGRKVISISTALPNLVDPYGGTTIDGYTQPGATVNTAAQGSNANIMIEVRSTGRRSIMIESAENVIRGLAISGADVNIEIVGEAADGNRIVGNFIGPSATGDFVAGSQWGMTINLGPDRNTIGTPALADRNVISGNTIQGIRINHGETSENVIQNNVIGLKPDLSDRLNQRIGVDIQWWTWGNLVGGPNPGEGNLISGNLQPTESNAGAVDLSHSATGNLVIGNYIGTLADGNTTTDYSMNTHGVLIKDDAKNNYFADNVITNSRWDGVKHRHNFSGANTFVRNRIGIGLQGDSAGNGRAGIRLNGHDNLYIDNIVGNSPELVWVVDESFDDVHTNHPPEQTLRNPLQQMTFVSPGSDPSIDLTPDGANANDGGDGDDGPHRLLNHAVVDGIGPGEVGGRACVGCKVEVLISGLSPSGHNTNARGGYWIGTVEADAQGHFGLSSNLITAGEWLTTLVIDAEGNTSESRTQQVPGSRTGNVGSTQASLPRLAAPPMPALPTPYQGEVFTCSWSDGTLSWSDVAAAEYYVFAVNGSGADVVKTYLGGHTATSIAAGPADRYEVSHWRDGFARDALCDGPGQPSIDSTVSLSVVDLAGNPVAGVNVDLFSEGRIQWITSSTTDASGVASFDVGAGCYVMTGVAPASGLFGSGQYANQSLCVAEGATETASEQLLINGTSTTIASQVLDRAGAGVAGISVDLFTSDVDGARLGYLRSTSTDAAGGYSFELASGGCYVATFIAPAGERFVESSSQWLNRYLCVEAGGTDSSASATLDRGAADTDGVLVGAVSDGGGAVAGVSIDLFSASGDGSRGTWLTYATSDGVGNFEFTVEAGCYVLTYIAPDGRTWADNSQPWMNRLVCVEAGQTDSTLGAVLN